MYLITHTLTLVNNAFPLLSARGEIVSESGQSKTDLELLPMGHTGFWRD